MSTHNVDVRHSAEVRVQDPLSTDSSKSKNGCKESEIDTTQGEEEDAEDDEGDEDKEGNSDNSTNSNEGDFIQEDNVQRSDDIGTTICRVC